MNHISKLTRSGLCLLLALCLLIGTPIAVMAGPANADDAVADAVYYCDRAQQLVDLIVDIAIEGEYADLFEGSNTSSPIKSAAINLIIDELDNYEDLMIEFGFEPTDENKELVAEEIYYAACVYYDELHRDGGGQESANTLTMIELIRFVLVEAQNYGEADALDTAELYHEINRIYKTEGEDAAVAYAESALGSSGETEPTEPEPTETEPTEPEPTEPEPTESEPTEPEPTEPEPTEPEPTEPEPTEPEPTEPEPTEPEPTNPWPSYPTEPEPTEPEPTEPEPTEPEPTNPWPSYPTEPEPTEPEPTEPEPTEPEPTEPEEKISRIYGSGRCETAIEIADMMKEALGMETFDAIIIANGDNFADALAGSYLAVQKNAPILLYRSNTVEMNLEYIRKNLNADGVVYLLGGTAAVPADMEAALADYHVTRLKGSTRFDTNLAILKEAGVEDKKILVCTGYDFADSLSASATGLPILLVNNGTGALTDSQIEFLENLDGNELCIVGGPNAVSEELQAAMNEHVYTDRMYGSTREWTSTIVAEYIYIREGVTQDTAVLAYSRNYPDGLCGGPLAYMMGAPMLLVNTGAEEAAQEYVSKWDIEKGLILGSTSVISDKTVNTVFGLN